MKRNQMCMLGGKMRARIEIESRLMSCVSRSVVSIRVVGSDFRVTGGRPRLAERESVAGASNPDNRWSGSRLRRREMRKVKPVNWRIDDEGASVSIA